MERERKLVRSKFAEWRSRTKKLAFIHFCFDNCSVIYCIVLYFYLGALNSFFVVGAEKFR